MEDKKEKIDAKDVYITVNNGMTRAGFDTVFSIIMLFGFIIGASINYNESDWFHFALSIAGVIYFAVLHNKAYKKLPKQ